jgi:hypothetical protein
MMELYLRFPICLHSVVLNQLNRDKFTLFTEQRPTGDEGVEKTLRTVARRKDC